MKIRPVGAALLLADEQTHWYDAANRCFWYFCERA